jgi:ribosomal protein S17
MREQCKRLFGVVTSDKMDKTIVVPLDDLHHPIYGKGPHQV